MKKTFVFMSVLLTIVLSIPSRTSADIINGGFEMPLDPGIPGWNSSTTGDATVGLGSGFYASLKATAEYDPLINQVESNAIISQTFLATAGQSLSFDLDIYYTGNFGYTGRYGEFWAKVYSETDHLEYQFYDWCAREGESLDWGKIIFPPFTNDGTYTVSFHARAIGWSKEVPPSATFYIREDARIDNVQLVPEPSTLALLLSAMLGGLLLWHRRR